jgi:uncharacterized protein (DUF983 family)
MRQWWAVFWAILRLRCPRCHRGRMFHGSFKMNDPCPVCGLLFQREEGYFLGAMYVSYGLSVVLIGANYLAITTLFSDLGLTAVGLLTLALYLPLVPAVFRYSRGLWVYFDRAVSPDDISAGSYERVRLQQIADQQSGPSASSSSE